MKNVKEKNEPQEDAEEGTTITIDFESLYKFKPDEMVIDITNTYYTNYAFTQVMHRDVFIDFLQIPGIKKDNQMQVNGIRVYLSHAHAKKLAKSLLRVLENIHKDGKMERFEDD